MTYFLIRYTILDRVYSVGFSTLDAAISACDKIRAAGREVLDITETTR